MDQEMSLCIGINRGELLLDLSLDGEQFVEAIQRDTTSENKWTADDDQEVCW